MEKDTGAQSVEETGTEEKVLMDRRGFFSGLKKWSKIVIGGALLGAGLLNAGTEKEAEAAGWANRAGGGGAAWANRGGGSAAVVRPGGGGGAWANRAGGGGAWANRGASWANRGGSWINRF